MGSKTPRHAVVTGASQGIGLAVAKALASAGASVTLAGRSKDRLSLAVDEVGPTANAMELDLNSKESIASIGALILDRLPRLDVLVNCGGAYSRGSWADVTAEDFERILRVNTLGTLLLTKALLPSLIAARGDIVFVNSSIVRSRAELVGPYAASKHAMLAAADSLREEVNDKGVRVLSVFPGRTATPGQQSIFAAEGREYTPDDLLQPSDIANVVMNAISLPNTAEVTDIHLRPRKNHS